VPVPESFTTTADRTKFLDFAGDELVMRAFVPTEGGAPALKISTQSADQDGTTIYVPINCVPELIENLQHLTNRANEMAEQQRAAATP
jgi:hypothetical protein